MCKFAKRQSSQYHRKKAIGIIGMPPASKAERELYEANRR
jgi:hypothetical protein